MPLSGQGPNAPRERRYLSTCPTTRLPTREQATPAPLAATAKRVAFPSMAFQLKCVSRSYGVRTPAVTPMGLVLRQRMYSKR